MELLETAYRLAIAVLTAPVSFVEWTTLKVEHRNTPDDLSDDWSPIGLSFRYNAQDYTWDPAQTIEGERYIYAFARRLWSEDAPTLVEEIKLGADGTIYAARMGARRFPDAHPLDGKDSPLPEKRTWDKVGTTIRFVRRLGGARLAHYFFATRMPLSRKFIEELRKKVRSWAPEILFDDLDYVLRNQSVEGVPNPTTFGEWDPNVVVTGRGPGTLQVPVLDPITIALHLHELAVSASEDAYDYIVPDESQSPEKRERLLKRQQKFVLASVIRVVLKNNKTTAYTADYHASQYLKDYQEQNEYRVQEMERWWKYLANWYLAAPIEFLSRVHFEHADDNRLSFFLPMLLCLLEANSAAAGRALLVELTGLKNWFHHTVMAAMPKKNIKSEEDTIAEKYQIPRKFLLAGLEAIKETLPHLHDNSAAAMWKALSAYSDRYKLVIFLGGEIVDDDPMAAARQLKASMQKLNIDIPEPGEIVEQWHEIASPGYTEKRLKVKKGLGRTGVVEMLDLMLSLRQFLEDRSFDHGLTLARSAADTSALLLEFAHGGRGTLSKVLLGLHPVAVIAATVLEIWVSKRELSDAEAKHDVTAMNAAGFKLAGSAVMAAGIIAWGAGLSTTPFFVAGLILMGIGAIISLFKDSPLDQFLKFCAFGEDGGGGEIVEGLEEMKKGEYGQHLEVLLNLICRCKCEPANDARTLIVTMGWVPEGAKLSIQYADHWRFGSEYFVRKGMAQNPGEGDTDKIQGTLALDARQQFPLRLSKAPYEVTDGAYSVDFAFQARLTTQLQVQLGDFKFVVPPHPQRFDIQRAKGVPAASVLPD